MTSARYNMYRDVHKGLRLLLAELLVSAGRTDFGSQVELERLRVQVQGVFALLKAHAQHEDTYFGPVLEQHCARVASELEADHEDQEAKLLELACLLTAIDAQRADAAQRGHQFQLLLASVVGELFVHMSEEERRAMPALWRKLSDRSLQELSARLLANLAAWERPLWLKCMLPALNRPERAALLVRMRAAMPAHAFDALLASARSQLEDEAYDALLSDLRALSSAA
jgi:hypothetical protein